MFAAILVNHTLSAFVFSSYTLHISTMLLNTILSRNQWTIKRSPGDGHRLLHSVVSSYASQINHTPAPTLQSLKESIEELITKSPADYMIYGFTTPNLIKQMKSYIYKKDCNSDFRYIAPQIISRLLNVDLTILTWMSGAETPLSLHPVQLACILD